MLVPSLISIRSVQRDSSGRFFIAVGELKCSSQQVLAFSENNASKLIVKISHFLPTRTLTLHPGHLIKITVEVCLGDYIISRAPSSGQLLVHEPSLSLAHILNAESEEICLKVIFTIASQETRLDPLQISKMIATKKISWVHATPFELSQWIAHGSFYLSSATSLRYIFSSGEALSESVVRGIQGLNHSGLRLINAYGPAEAGVVTSTEIDISTASTDAQFTIPIGRPLANIAVYVVDKHLRPVPAGVNGEILIAGAGNIANYLNKPERSAVSSVEDTLTPDGFYQGQIKTMYRSVDIGRYETNGQL